MRRAQASEAVVESRRAHRYTVDIPATLATETDAERPIRVMDLSRRGFGAEMAGRIAVDSTVTLTLPGVCNAKAKIMWSDDSRFGAEFLAPQRLYMIPSVIDQAGDIQQI